MYYKMMKLVAKPDNELKTFCISNCYISHETKDSFLVDSKFYQKLFVLLISLSTILIFPESPKDLENICKNYNSIKLCNVW